MQIRKPVIATLLGLLVNQYALAQKEPRAELGFKAENLYQFTDLDSVNLFNGNLNISLPIGPRYHVGGRLSYQLTLVYNGKVWDYEDATTPDGDVHFMARPNIRSNAGVGWRLSLGRLLPRTDPTVGDPYLSEARGGWIYEAPTGEEFGCSDVLAGDGATVDSYGADVLFASPRPMRMVKVSDTHRTIEMPTGEIHHFFKSDGDWPLREIRDRYGNFIYVTPGQNTLDQPIWTILDSGGRQVIVTFEYKSPLRDAVDSGLVVSSIQVAGIGGNPLTYTFTYTDIDVPHGCGHQPPPDDYLDPTTPQDTSGTTRLPFLTRLTLPDTTHFDFGYHHTSASCEQGALKTFKLPTGGVMSYDYQQYYIPASRCGEPAWAERPVGIKRRITPDGTWDYLQNVGAEVAVDDGSLPNNGQPGPCGLDEGKHPLGYAVNPIRWTRTSVISPAVGRGGVERRTRTDHYFNVWSGTTEDPLDNVYTYRAPYGRSGVPAAPEPAAASVAPVVSIPPSSAPPTVAAADTEATITVQGRKRALSTRAYEDCDTSGACNHLARSTFVAWASTHSVAYTPELQATTAVYDSAAVTAASYVADGGCGPPGCYVDEEFDDPDGIGHYRKMRIRSNFPHSTLVDSETTYRTWTKEMRKDEELAWLPEIYDEVKRTENGSATIVRYCFDASGFLTGVRTLAGTTAGPSDLLAAFMRDAQGELIVERYYGGDVQALAGSTACDGVPAEGDDEAAGLPQYEIRHQYTTGVRRKSEYYYPGGNSLGFATLDLSIEPYTGLVLSSSDVAGVTTTFEYYSDSLRLWRQSAPGMALTEYTYTNVSSGVPARVDIVTSGLADTVRRRVEYDGMGRLFRDSTLMPGGQWSSVETRFDGLGRRKEITVPIDGGASPPLGGSLPGAVTSYQYDLPGRMTKLVAPDGATSTATFTGVRAVVRSRRIAAPDDPQHPVDITEQYDNLGRLREVAEPAGPTTESSPLGDTVTTTYSYDTGGRLISVSTNGAGSPQRPRVFEYDGRGFLLGETNPETSRATYSQYDARGHSGLRQAGGDPTRDLSLKFDKAERLVSVSERNPSGGWRYLKTFTYGADNVPHSPTHESKVRGKLLNQTRYNYAGTSAFYDPQILALKNLKVQESFVYADDAGKLTQRDTDIVAFEDNSPPTELRTIRQSVTYNDLGQISTSVYPFCLYCGYSPASLFANVRWNYEAGKLKSVDSFDEFGYQRSFVSDISYWPNGTAKTVAHANFIGDKQTVDVSGRTSSLTFGARQVVAGMALAGYLECQPAAIQTQPASVSISSGQSTTLSVVMTATTTTPVQYQWYRYDPVSGFSEAVSGATSSSLNVSPSSTTRYFVRATNDCRYVDSSSATVTVNGACNTPTVEHLTVNGLTEKTSSHGVTVQSGAMVTMSVTAAGTSPLTYQWYRVDGTAEVPVGAAQSLTVSVSTTASYRVAISNSCGSASGYVSVIVKLGAPVGLTATKSAPMQITLQWQPVSGAYQYGIERRSGGGQFSFVSYASGTTYVDLERAASTGYAYRVFALDAKNGSQSSYSNVDVGTTLAFTAVVPGIAMTQGHIQELLIGVNTIRAITGLPPLTWTQMLPGNIPAPATGSIIHSSHLTALRREMNIGLQAAGAVAYPYTDLSLPGVLIRAVHITELQLRAQ